MIWEVMVPCPDGKCEREENHPPPHWYTVWKDGFPAYPIYWSDMDIEIRVKNFVGKAVEKYKMGESTDWAVSLNWTPNQGSMQLAWNIVLVQSAPIIGQKNVQVLIEAAPSPDEETIDKVILNGFTELRTLKAQQMIPMGKER